jgi:hypothetical protein
MCCPSDADCSNIIGENCANGTGDLYSSTTEIKREGFCCQRGKYAFALANSGVGCADDLSDLQVSMTQLAVLSSGKYWCYVTYLSGVDYPLAV